MLRLVVLGPHTRILSSLCAACPHSPAGCCVAPPRMDWSDVGRVVALGGLEWLVGEVAAHRLVPDPGGLVLKKRKGVVGKDGPRLAKCVYLGEAGCTIDHDRRPATCNYFVCESVFAEDAPNARPAREAHAELARSYADWDVVLSARVAERFPEGPTYDAAFFAWLGEAFNEVASRR